jgi:hypothetical protein
MKKLKNQDLVESPLQKFNRLEKELKELKDDLNEMNNYATDEDKNSLVNFNPIDLSKQVEELNLKVKNLHLEAINSRTSVNQLNNKAKKF